MRTTIVSSLLLIASLCGCGPSILWRASGPRAPHIAKGAFVIVSSVSFDDGELVPRLDPEERNRFQGLFESTLEQMLSGRVVHHAEAFPDVVFLRASVHLRQATTLERSVIRTMYYEQQNARADLEVSLIDRQGHLIEIIGSRSQQQTGQGERVNWLAHYLAQTVADYLHPRIF